MLAYTEIERAVVMYLELLKSKAHMASWQAEFKLKDEALQSPEGRFASITLPRLKLFCSMFKPAAAFKGCGIRLLQDAWLMFNDDGCFSLLFSMFPSLT